MTGRFELLDLARGVALIAMCIFHFAFDLELFGVAAPGFSAQLHWRLFARAIATSFLFLVGFSLFLAHFEQIIWARWCIRFAKICAAALAITIATYFATPSQYIFFGILHQIAFASLIGLLFVRLNGWLLFSLALAVFAIGQGFTSSLFNEPVWYWLGLSVERPISSDYVPVFPWFAPVLLGIGAARLAKDFGYLQPLSQVEMKSQAANALKFFGRNSLVFYLLHQPIMIGVLLGALWLTGQIRF